MKAVPNVKLLPSMLDLREIFLSTKIMAHFYGGQWHITKPAVEQN